MGNFNIMTDLLWLAAAIYCLYLGASKIYSPKPRPLLLLIHGVVLVLSGLWVLFVWLFI